MVGKQYVLWFARKFGCCDTKCHAHHQICSLNFQQGNCYSYTEMYEMCIYGKNARLLKKVWVLKLQLGVVILRITNVRFCDYVNKCQACFDFRYCILDNFDKWVLWIPSNRKLINTNRAQSPRMLLCCFYSTSQTLLFLCYNWNLKRFQQKLPQLTSNNFIIVSHQYSKCDLKRSFFYLTSVIPHLFPCKPITVLTGERPKKKNIGACCPANTSSHPLPNQQGIN